LRKLVVVIAALVVVGIIGFVAAYLYATRYGEIAPIDPVDPASFDPALVERGEMLAAIGDCMVCHTAAGGEKYAGGLALPTPFGTVHSTNITPDPETGIGRWSEAAFVRAMHLGIDRSGNQLYPVFPYDHFALVTEEDLGAIYAYLMSKPAIAKPATPNDMPFPFSFRPILEGWKILFHRPKVFEPDPSKDEEWNRGAYLVQGLAHCGACHSPRNAFGAVETSQPLAGGTAENWSVPAIGAASHSPVPWTLDNYVNYLFDGWDEDHGIAAGPMKPVVDELYNVEEDDVFAMAAYLVSLKEAPAEAEIAAIVEAIGALDWKEDERPGGANAPSDPALLRGEKLFFDQCADCHKARVAEQQPASLGLTPTVTAPDARNIADIIIHGIQPPEGASQRSMPGQDIAITNEEMVDLINFVRWRFTDLPAWTDVAQAVADKRERPTSE
jgi:mono/diheme cytochrome c family protein